MWPRLHFEDPPNGVGVPIALRKDEVVLWVFLEVVRRRCVNHSRVTLICDWVRSIVMRVSKRQFPSSFAIVAWLLFGGKIISLSRAPGGPPLPILFNLAPVLWKGLEVAHCCTAGKAMDSDSATEFVSVESVASSIISSL